MLRVRVQATEAGYGWITPTEDEVKKAMSAIISPHMSEGDTFEEIIQPWAGVEANRITKYEIIGKYLICLYNLGNSYIVCVYSEVYEDLEDMLILSINLVPACSNYYDLFLNAAHLMEGMS